MLIQNKKFDKYLVCSHCFTDMPSRIFLSLFPWASLFLRQKKKKKKKIEIRPVNNPTVASKHSVKEEPISLILNQKPEMTKFSDKSMLKAETG